MKPGPTAYREAEKARRRFLSQVDEKRNPKSKATVNQLIDRWLEVLDVEVSTRRGYEQKINKHVRPLLGTMQAGRLGVEELETFYAMLRHCRDHCRGRKYVVHRKAGEHWCTAVRRPHACKGLADSSVRQVHWIISGFLDAGVRWGWIALNPASNAKKPALPQPEPKPPTSEEAAKLVNEAFKDPDWGSFVWTAMTTGGDAVTVLDAANGDMIFGGSGNVRVLDEAHLLLMAIESGPDGPFSVRGRRDISWSVMA